MDEKAPTKDEEFHVFDQTNGLLKKFAGDSVDEDGNPEASGEHTRQGGPSLDPGVGLGGANPF
ncbi:MAG: hypothetical protein JWR36_2528 [Glaciihabitans sp.]|jgi:hypothetical protein|nr:hypothetical protein [Glaciihabitans sp.]